VYSSSMHCIGQVWGWIVSYNSARLTEKLRPPLVPDSSKTQAIENYYNWGKKLLLSSGWSKKSPRMGQNIWSSIGHKF
jgi:hypothetical protein